jgi:hypothetical protein
MSGPKVVNLEAVRRRRQRESLVQLRELRDLVAEWRSEMEKAGLLSDSLKAETEVMFARLENLRETEQWESLFNELPARRAFFKDGTASAQQTRIERISSQRERQRRLELAIAMLKRELQLAGVPVPPELEVVSDTRLASNESELSRLESLLQRTLGKMPSQIASGNKVTDQQLELASALKDESAAPAKFEDWLAAHSGENHMHKAKNDRLARALAELELHSPGEVASHLYEKARLITTEPTADRRALLTDSLLIEAGELCQSVRELKEAKLNLKDAIAEIEPFQSPDANAWRQRLSAALDNPSSTAIRELATAARKWCSEAAAREDSVLRREVVLKALAALGYEVREGMATAWAESGRVVVRKPSESSYGVELSFAAAGTAVQTRVVSFAGPERSSESAQRDREVEVSWCGDFQQMRKLIEAEGVQPTLVHAKAPGEMPVKVVSSSGQERRDVRSFSASPRDRQAE